MIPESGNLPVVGTESAASCSGFRSRGIDCTVSGSVCAGSVCNAFCSVRGEAFFVM